MKTVGEEAFAHYVYNGQTRLRCGYTTGTCAALAAAGAARLLLTGHVGAAVTLTTPKGVTVTASLVEAMVLEDGAAARCAVTKDAGDDSDVTDGMLVCAAVRRRTTGGIFIDGGEGVGRVTKAGLDQPVGAAAINHVPRAMIEEQVRTVCTALGHCGFQYARRRYTAAHVAGRRTDDRRALAHHPRASPPSRVRHTIPAAAPLIGCSDLSGWLPVPVRVAANRGWYGG